MHNVTTWHPGLHSEEGWWGERKKCLFSLKRCVCFERRQVRTHPRCRMNEWMKRGRKTQTICAFCPLLPCQHRRVAVRESPSRVNPLNFLPLLKSPWEEEHKVGDGDHTGRHLDGKVPHTVLSSCIAPSAGLQRLHWTYETALHMNGERESPAWSLAVADPSCKRHRHPSPDTLNYIILHNFKEKKYDFSYVTSRQYGDMYIYNLSIRFLLLPIKKNIPQWSQQVHLINNELM